MRFGSRCSIFLLAVLSMSLLSTRSVTAEEPTAPQKCESDLSSRPWRWGVFVQGGGPPEYKIVIAEDRYSELYFDLKLQLFAAGFEAGRQTRRFDGPRLLRGRGEAMLEVLPFWMARYPSQTITLLPITTTVPSSFHWKNEDFHGASVTPFLLRWNFSQRDSARVVPWAQLGGGLLWTNHKFPYSYYGGTSVINFTPQVGAGVNVFNRPKHSVNFALKAIHISNASLGDHNPGLNQTLQFSAGYSWWK